MKSIWNIQVIGINLQPTEHVGPNLNTAPFKDSSAAEWIYFPSHFDMVII